MSAENGVERGPNYIKKNYGRIVHHGLGHIAAKNGQNLVDLIESAPESLPGILDPAYYHILASITLGSHRRAGLTVFEHEPIPPPEIPHIVAYTHHSTEARHLDIVAPVSYLYCEHGISVRGLAKNTIFKLPIVGPAIEASGAYPFNRGNPDPQPYFDTINYLEEGQWTAVAAEAGSVKGLEVAKLMGTLAVIATIANVNILPVATVPKPLAKGTRLPRIKFPPVILDFQPVIPHGWDERDNYEIDELIEMFRATLEKRPNGLPKSLRDQAKETTKELKKSLQSGIDHAVDFF